MIVHVYPAEDGWRWNCKAGNGRIVAESGEAYSTRAGCMKGARRVFKYDSRKVDMYFDNHLGKHEGWERLR